jgi:hypothetical protein
MFRVFVSRIVRRISVSASINPSLNSIGLSSGLPGFSLAQPAYLPTSLLTSHDGATARVKTVRAMITEYT